MACLSSQDKYVTSWASDSGLFDPLILGPGKPSWVQCHFHLGLIWMTCIHNLWCAKDGCSELHSAQIRALPILTNPTNLHFRLHLCSLHPLPRTSGMEVHKPSQLSICWKSSPDPQGTVRQYHRVKPGWANLESSLSLQSVSENLEGLDPRPGPRSSCFVSINSHSTLVFKMICRKADGTC